MWIKLKCIKYLDEGGRNVAKHPGQWVNVNKNTAIAWIAAGEAERPDSPEFQPLPYCGVVAKGEGAINLSGIEIVRGDIELAFDRTLYLDTGAVRFEMRNVVPGFHFLERWEIAVPLLDYETLAQDIARSSEEKALAQATLRDLRVLVYQPGAIFMRRCDNVYRLLDTWAEERPNFSNDLLSFLVALYKTKPVMMALPQTWVS